MRWLGLITFASAAAAYGGPLVAVGGAALASIGDAGELYYWGRVGEVHLVSGPGAEAWGRVVVDDARGRAYYLLERTRAADCAGFGDVVFSSGEDILLARSFGAVYDKDMRHFPGAWRRLEPLPARRLKGARGEGLSAASAPDRRIQYYLNLIRTDDVRDDLAALTSFPTRYSFSPYLGEVANYLRQRLSSFGLTPTYQVFITGHDLDACHLFGGGRAVIVGGEGLILATEDNGATWRVVPSGVIDELVDVYFVDDLRGWAVGANGVVLRSEDGGRTWRSVPRPTPRHLTGVHFISAAEGWVCGTGGVILHSTDGGWTWTAQDSRMTDTLFEIQFLDENAGYAVGWHGEVRATTDGGDTWERKRTPFSDPATPQDIVELTGLSFISPQEGWVVGNRYDLILHTADGGNTWDIQRYDVVKGEYLGAVAWGGGGRTVAVGGEKGAVVVTEDGGLHWTKYDAPADYPLTGISMLPEGKGLAVGYGSCVDYTGDGGRHWSSLRSNLPEELGWPNVVADVIGTTHPDKYYLICAHYDSISEKPMEKAPGADDNASGAAAALAVARALAQARPEATVRFVFFAGEEQGLVGSRDFARTASERGDDIRAVWNMDMVGYTGDGPADVLMTYNDSSAFMASAGAKAARLYVPELTYLSENNPFRANSDHYSFWQEGFAAALLAEEDANGVYPHYHKSTDTADKVSPPFIAANARHAAAAVMSWAGGGKEGPTLDLDGVVVYPNPYRPHATSARGVTFAHCPADARISLWDLAGFRVAEGRPDSGGTWVWEPEVASGVYLYVIELDRERRLGKVAVVK